MRAKVGGDEASLNYGLPARWKPRSKTVPRSDPLVPARTREPPGTADSRRNAVTSRCLYGSTAVTGTYPLVPARTRELPGTTRLRINQASRIARDAEANPMNRIIGKVIRTLRDSREWSDTQVRATTNHTPLT